MLQRKNGTGLMNSLSSPSTKGYGSTSELRRIGINTFLNEGCGLTIFITIDLFIGGVKAANTLRKRIQCRNDTISCRSSAVENGAEETVSHAQELQGRA
mmetsp:Transcript_14575/g.14772  ORF Transcript_14575/g.14772 Transcript_14575/m.14772 type:complete len:99 (-) Transcript_14575:56-352(-)